MLSKRYDLAILYYEKGLVRKIAEKEVFLTNLGRCYYRIKEYQTALNNFEEALEADPKYLKAIDWKLKTYDALEKWNEMISHFEKHTEFQNENT